MYKLNLDWSKMKHNVLSENVKNSLNCSCMQASTDKSHTSEGSVLPDYSLHLTQPDPCFLKKDLPFIVIIS